MVVGTKAAEAEKAEVLIGQSFEILTYLQLGHSIRKVIFITVYDVLRHIGVEILEGSYSDSVQHPAYVIFRMWKISECHKRMYYSLAHIAS